jgi:hypothetical protein
MRIKGMMPDVTVDANDLRALVRLLSDAEVTRHCYVAAVQRTLPPTIQRELQNEFDVAEPLLQTEVDLRYRELMDAFKTGKDLRAALSKFLQSENV